MFGCVKRIIIGAENISWFESRIIRGAVGKQSAVAQMRNAAVSRRDDYGARMWRNIVKKRESLARASSSQ